MVVGRWATFGLVLVACGEDGKPIDSRSPETIDAKTFVIPSSGIYTGMYEVPVAPELASAARYEVTDFEWTVVGNSARLAYNLPRALVGRSVRVDFTGPLNPDQRGATLVGAAGTAECTFSAHELVCTETMRGLLPLEVDFAVVEKLAADTYAGPASDRVNVATQFARDPIGIARFRPESLTGTIPPANEDHPR